MNKEEVLDSFAGKICGIRNYKSNKQKFFASDFLDEKILDDFLDEIYSGESDITPAGKSFIKNYFGFANLATELLQRHASFLSIQSSPKGATEVKLWLENLEPMEVARFVEESRSNILKDSSFKEELMPPQNFS